MRFRTFPVYLLLVAPLSAADPAVLPSVPAGFKVELVAREPLVRNPCAMAFDARGRLFVGQGPQYRNPKPDTPGDTIELLGPIGGHFVWSASQDWTPLLLVAGGSGVVPLMCMLRHRKRSGSAVQAALLYSTRTREDVIYREELTALARSDDGFTLQIAVTRESPPGWADWDSSRRLVRSRQPSQARRQSILAAFSLSHA